MGYQQLVLLLAVLSLPVCFAVDKNEEKSEAVIFDPIIVEGEKTLPAEPQKIEVPAGEGAKAIDSPTNELGVDLENLNRDDDISLARRKNIYELSPQRASWYFQGRTHISSTPEIRLRSAGPVDQGYLDLETGYHRDHRRYPFLDNAQTQYNPDDDYINYFSKNRDGQFFKLRGDYRSYSLLGSQDYLSDNVLAGPRVTGRRKKWQWEGNLQRSWGAVKLTLFSFLHDTEFDSQEPLLLSSEARDLKWGVQLRTTPIQGLEATVVGFRETLIKEFEEGSQEEFSRWQGTLRLAYASDFFSWFEYKTTGRVDVIRDESAGEQSASFGTWDLGLWVSSPSKYVVGGVAKLRRYSKVPTPFQTFGDGALVQPSLDLPPETGIRAAVGPWLKWGDWQIHVLAFTEESQEVPIAVATSPVTARFIALGGVWTKGLEIKAKHQTKRFLWAATYTYQKSLNDSEIAWQRGHFIPGRPSHWLLTEVGLKLGYWSLGADFGIRGKEAVDLGGNWTREPRFVLGAQLGYGRTNWKLSLRGMDLLASSDVAEVLRFEGAAGPNILEPEAPLRQFQLVFEGVL